jgi:chemotaxis protein CheD
MIIDQTRLNSVYLRPGEAHFSAEPTLITTVLGSCISVTMFCNRLKFGGICHILLPQCNIDTGCKGRCEDMFRYLNCSVKAMIRTFEHRGIRSGDIQVKLFGGSDMFEFAHDQGRTLTVGQQNIAMAKATLHAENLKVAAKHVGGKFGRKIFFFTHTGEVLMKRLQSGAIQEGGC